MSVISLLRPLGMTWAAAALLPVPLLFVIEPAENAIISCVYLGLASAWFATAVTCAGGMPDSRAAWRAKTMAIILALSVNLLLFIALGLVANVQSNIPFPLMATLSVIPAMGLIPWLLLRVQRPFVAVVFGAVILLASKLAGCVVARIVYGPNYIGDGYVSDDWHTAKLMISLFWILSTGISLGLLAAGYWQRYPRAARAG